MKIKHFMLLSAFTAFVFTGCEDDDDDQVIQNAVEISVDSQSVSEDEAAIAVNFYTSTAFANDVTITYAVSGTASDGEDFQSLSGSVVLPAGETVVSESLTVIDDDEVESAEDIVITIQTVTGIQDIVVGLKDEVIISISDNDSYPFENGILVSHEGNFFQGNASVSFVTNDFTTVTNDIFKSANDTDVLGDNVQSMAFNDDEAYIVVNNSQKIEVVNRYTFESIATIGGPTESDFLNPRYMAIANGKGYVTNWGDGSNPNDDYVAVINLEDHTVETKIPVVEGPERIIAKDNMLYVVQQGGYNQNNVVSVIDATTNMVTSTVTVGDRPNSIQVDATGAVWVLSGGNPAWTGNETAGQLDKIDTTTNTVASTFSFAQTEHPGSLVIEDATMYYYLSTAVYKLESAATELPTMALIDGLSFYDMAINEGKLYGVDAKDYASNGSLEIYDLTTNSLVTSKEVSIIPGEIYFNGTAQR